MSFKKGQELWLLEPITSHKKTPKEYIRKCIYKGTDSLSLYSMVQYIIDGELGMTKAITGGAKLFETLEELKSHIIALKLNYVNNLQKEICDINSEIDEIKSMKDISEDREGKLNTILEL